MNNEKDKNEELQTKNNKKKKHFSKKLWCLIILLICIIVLVIAMIYTGCWNPFKNRDISSEAEKIYETHEEAKDMAYALGYESSWADTYGVNANYPYGLMIMQDNGKDSISGTLMIKETVMSSYYDKLGIFFDEYCMKNEEYALEKYNGFKIGAEFTAPYAEETIIDDNTRICYWIDKRDDSPNYYVLKGTVVYDMWSDDENWVRNQKMFDLLGIKYTVPNLKEVMGKIS